MTRDQMPFVASALMVLNGLDTMFTLWFMSHQMATEANPVMAALIGFHPLAFAAVKLLLVNAFVIACWSRSHWGWVRSSLLFGLVLYLNVVSYHLANLAVIRGLN